MRIEHIGIWTKDLERMRAFYQTYFNMRCSDKYENDKKGFSSYFLSFESGCRIEIMTRPDIKDKNNDSDFLKGFTHLAISVGDKTAVDELTRRLKTDGIKIHSEPRTTGDGYYEIDIKNFQENFIPTNHDSFLSKIPYVRIKTNKKLAYESAILDPEGNKIEITE